MCTRFEGSRNFPVINNRMLDGYEKRLSYHKDLTVIHINEQLFFFKCTISYENHGTDPINIDTDTIINKTFS
jgi:hypothetical protein